MAQHPPAHPAIGVWPEIVLRKNAFKRLAEHDPQLVHFDGDSCLSHVIGEPNLSAIGRRTGVHRSTLSEIDLNNRAATITVISRLTHLRTQQLGVEWPEAMADLCEMTEAHQAVAVAV